MERNNSAQIEQIRNDTSKREKELEKQLKEAQDKFAIIERRNPNSDSYNGKMVELDKDYSENEKVSDESRNSYLNV